MTEADKLKKTKELEDYRQNLSSKTLDELHKIEDELIEEMDKIDEEVSKEEYDLPEADNYKEVAAGIQKLLAKQTISWEYTLGQLTLYNFWDPENKPKKINYPTLDGTLRQLGGLQFTGPEEWESVIKINDYFKELHQQYINTTEKVYDAAAKHNLIQQELELKTPIPKKVNLEK